jgi:hypothetical protein
VADDGRFTDTEEFLRYCKEETPRVEKAFGRKMDTASSKVY